MARPHDRRCPHLGSPPFERRPVLSSSYRNRLARPEEEEEPPPPPPDLVVSGTLTPDATGDYFEAGVHNGQPYYARDDDAWFIWYYHFELLSRHYWRITDQTGASFPPYWETWETYFCGPAGDYVPISGATGTATVAEP